MGACCTSSNAKTNGKAKSGGGRSSRSLDPAAAPAPQQMASGVNGKTSILLPDLAAQSEHTSSAKKMGSSSRHAEGQRGARLLPHGERGDDSNIIDIESDDQRECGRGSRPGAGGASGVTDSLYNPGGSRTFGDQLMVSAARKDENNSGRGRSAGAAPMNRGTAGRASAEPGSRPKPPPKPKISVDFSPKVRRHFKIYSITSRPPVQSPCSRDTEWQQVLQLYAQRLNMSSFQANLGNLNPASIKNKKQAEIQSQLEQIQTHREIELMVSILTLRNRNWVQEQIKMSRRLANMRPVSFESLVVTREFLQLKEHFNWLVWAVGYYYFQMSRIEQFFQFHQTKQMQNKADGAAGQAGPNSQRQKQQNMLYHEINHLLGQVNTLKGKLPSPISKKWTEGYTFQGVHFRMLPLSDGQFVRNEMKALKYLQNELMELNQIQNQLEEHRNSGAAKQNQQNQGSIYKQLIMPLLSAVECGGFFIFASPLIFIQGYSDDGALHEERPDGADAAGERRGVAEPAAIGKSTRAQSYQQDGGADQMQFLMSRQAPRERRRTVLSHLYGAGVYRNRDFVQDKLKKGGKQGEEAFMHAFSFLQENLGEIDDPLLRMMPLLKNITKENVLPIIDFDDQTQVDLNFLLIHVFDCLPSVGLDKANQSTVALSIPSDLNSQIAFLDIPDVEQVSLDDVRKYLSHGSKPGPGAGGQRAPAGQNAAWAAGTLALHQLSRPPGGHANDLADEGSHVQQSEDDDAVAQSMNKLLWKASAADGSTGTGGGEKPARVPEARLFSKHGFDIVMITNQTKGVVSELESSESPGQVNRPRQNENGLQLQVKDSILVNKRAHALYAAREEESTFEGLLKRNDNQALQSLLQSQGYGHRDAPTGSYHGQAYGQSKAQNSLGGALGPGASTKPPGLASGGLLGHGPRKQSILRRVPAQAGFFGMPGSSAAAHGLYADTGDYGGPGGGPSEGFARGNALVVAHNSATEFKLKYALINHTYSASVEQIYMQIISQVVRVLEDTDAISSIQALKDLLHRKGLNLRFEWLLLSKVKSNFHRELIMIHILVRTMKKIINEEVKIKAQVFAPNKPKPPNASAPKSLADHQKHSSKREQTQLQQSMRQFDHFIGANQENFKDNLVFFSNTLLRRKFSKQKHVFDETLIGLFLSRLKVLPIANAVVNLGHALKQRFLGESEVNYLESKQILEEIIAAPSQNPALFMSSIQTYFNVEIEQEFLRKCRQDKYLFLSKLTSQPMVMNNLTSVNLRCHIYYTLKEYSYFMLANQMQQTQMEQAKEVQRLSVIDSQYGGDGAGQGGSGVLAANQNLRNKIFQHKQSNKNSRKQGRQADGQDLDATNQSMRSSKGMMAGAGDPGDARQASLQKRGHNDSHQSHLQSSTASEQRLLQQNLHGRGNPAGPMGGAPGRRESFVTGSGVMQLRAAAAVSTSSTQQNYQQHQVDLLNSSSITDNNKNRFQPSSQVNMPGLPAHQNMLPNESVVSRSSALQSQAQAFGQKSSNLDLGSGKQLTPRQFKNIDNIDKRDTAASKGSGRAGLQRQVPQIQGFNFDQDIRAGAAAASPEIVIPPILYKLNTRCLMDHGAYSPGMTGADGTPMLPGQQDQGPQATSNFMAYYSMPRQHLFDTWIMYLESILKEVHSVEGAEQILLEALNYLALTIYFGEQAAAPMGQFGRYGAEAPSPLQSPGSERSARGLGLTRQAQSLVGGDDSTGENFDRDQFMKVCAKIKDIQATASKCSPEVLVVSQIICALHYEQIPDDSVFPIESEKSYLTALICLFQIVGDPRGRGNFSVPYMLLVTWKLSLLSLSIENRKVHDAEFAEELFDATLCNLLNHKTHFRNHQNEKLSRVIIQQDRLDRKNLLGDLNKEGHGQGRRAGGNFNSRRSHYQGDVKDLMYRVSSFEHEMDLEQKLKNQFDVRKFQVRKDPNGQELVNMSRQDSQNTPRSRLRGPNGSFLNLQNSQVVQSEGIQSLSQNKPRDPNIILNNINQEGIANISVSQSYQGIGLAGLARSIQPTAPLNGQARQGGGHNLQVPGAGLQRSALPRNDRQLHDDLSNVIGNNQLKQMTRAQHMSHNPNSKYGFNANRQDRTGGGAHGLAAGNGNAHMNSFLEANISDIEFDLEEDTEKDANAKAPGAEPSFYSPESEFVLQNFSDDCVSIPEVPFVHWSIYRQSIQNVVLQQGHKFQRNQKQMNKFLCQMFKNVLNTAIDKKILRPWLLKYNLIMYQSGMQWKNNQIKQAVFFQTAQMISSRSSSKSFAKNESEYSLSLSIQGSMISQGGGHSFRSSSKTQHLGSYSSIINTDNGSINKGDVHGVLYSWGSDAQGQLGHDSFAHLTQKPVSQKVLYPRMLSVLKDEFIKEVCCGYAHTLAITIHGAVYSWGNNESRQLGLGPNAPDFVRKAKLIPGLKNIVKLSAGNEHSVALNKNHEIYSWGSCYQTGQNDTLNRHTPQKMSFFRNMRVQQVACGGLHTLALTKDHKVFCWGSTEGGQLGLPTNQIILLCNNEENAVKSPQLLVSLIDQEVTQLACGETHSLCLCKDGRIFGWGTSMYGQLGLGFSADTFEPGVGMQKSKVPEPRLIEALQEEQISKIFCGSTFSLFLTNNGELYGCGMNDVGQLGEDGFNDLSALESAKIGQMQTSDVTVPTQVSSLQNIKIQTVACGEAHVLAIDGDGIDSRNMLWAWGQYKNGQLGLGELSMKLNPRPVQNLASSAIHKIACGSAHSLALVGDASNVTTLSPNFYAGNEILANAWGTDGIQSDRSGAI